MKYTREQIEAHAKRLLKEGDIQADIAIRQLLEENDALKADLVKEAARTANEKLRADQMTKQHKMQANMHSEASWKLFCYQEDAERWKKARNLISAENQLGRARFVFNMLEAPMNVMRGSVAEHFTKSIDAARGGKAMTLKKYTLPATPPTKHAGGKGSISFSCDVSSREEFMDYVAQQFSWADSRESLFERAAYCWDAEHVDANKSTDKTRSSFYSKLFKFIKP